MRKAISSLALSLGLFFAPGMAFAVPVTWTLQNATFADGSTASGSFVYDADTNTVSNVNITATAGSNHAQAVFTLPHANIAVQPRQIVFQTSNTLAEGEEIIILATPQLTNSGGTITPGLNSRRANCADAACTTFLQTPQNYITGGTLLSSLPPPTIPTLTEWALILLGTAMAGGALVTLQRRRHIA